MMQNTKKKEHAMVQVSLTHWARLELGLEQRMSQLG